MNKILCVALVFTALLSGCGNMSKGKTVAEAQVVTFHQQLNDQKLSSIISASDPEMLKVTPKADLTKLYTVIHNKLGKVTNTKNTNWNVRTFNADTTVVLVQDTKFEKGSGVETFTFRIKGQKAYLLGYYINSTDLIMK